MRIEIVKDHGVEAATELNPTVEIGWRRIFR